MLQSHHQNGGGPADAAAADEYRPQIDSFNPLNLHHCKTRDSTVPFVLGT
ncbi:hypothetical protein A2U01_0074086, partial [Trifolium medium]|nr:hypothetical protein [Trifolium medium]